MNICIHRFSLLFPFVLDSLFTFLFQIPLLLLNIIALHYTLPIHIGDFEQLTSLSSFSYFTLLHSLFIIMFRRLPESMPEDFEFPPVLKELGYVQRTWWIFGESNAKRC